MNSSKDEPTVWHLHTRVSLLEQSMMLLSSELAKINANLSKLVWAVAIGILGAFVQFIVRGGLLG